MTQDQIAEELRTSLEFFERSSSCLTEDDSTFSPADGALTACQQIGHIAATVDWFFEGAFRPEGFDMDFEAHAQQFLSATSISAEKQRVRDAFATAIKTSLATSNEEWAKPLPPGPIMGDEPRFAIVSGLVEHTAHHRGALTVYSRLRGHTPKMPYMDMD